VWKAAYLHEQMFLQAAQAAQASDRLVAYSRMKSFIERTSSQVFAHSESCFLRLCMQNVLFVTRDTMWISDVTPCALLGRGIVPCPFRGVSGRSPEQDAQPFLRVAEGGLEKWWWRRETPQGFCGYSAYLAVPLNSSDFMIIHICCQ